MRDVENEIDPDTDVHATADYRAGGCKAGDTGCQRCRRGGTKMKQVEITLNVNGRARVVMFRPHDAGRCLGTYSV